MTPELRLLIRRFCVEAVRREMTDNRLSSYIDSSIAYAKSEVQGAIKITMAALEPEDFRG